MTRCPKCGPRQELHRVFKHGKYQAEIVDIDTTSAFLIRLNTVLGILLEIPVTWIILITLGRK
jgi:Sec-independent protein secretion pathway component TatC